MQLSLYMWQHDIMEIGNLLGRILSLADELPGSGVGHSAGAGSPFSDYVAGVAIYVLLVGFLVAGLLIGAFLIINLGLMSKRPGDRIGGRTPSDLGILKENVWPEDPYVENTLPAELEEAQRVEEQQSEKEKKIA